MRATLEHAVGDEKAAHFSVLAGDVVPAKKPDPASTCWRWSAPGPTRTRRSSSRTRATVSSRRGAGLRCVVTVSSYTGAEDFSEAVLVVSSLGDPGEPACGPRQSKPRRTWAYITLDDLQACLRSLAQGEVT